MLVRTFALSFIVALTMSLSAVMSAHAQPETGSTIYLPAVSDNYTRGWTWGTTYTVTIAARMTGLPLAAVDNEGWPHLFWYYTVADNQVHHAYLDEGNWHTTLPAASLEGDSLLTNAPFVDSAGRIHLLWFNKLAITEAQPYRFMHSTFEDGAWQPPTEVFRSLYSTISAWGRLGDGERLRVAVTNGFLAWRAAVLEYSGGWQRVGEFTLPDNADIVWPDAASGAHVFGDDTTTMMYWRWTGGEVGGAQSLGSGKFYGRGMAIDQLNNIHLYWKAVTSVNALPVSVLQHQCINSAPNASAVSSPAGVNGVREVVGAGEQGTSFVLAWQEQDDKRIARWEGCVQGEVAYIPDADDGPSASLRAVAVNSRAHTACVFMQQGTTDVYTVRCARID